jgi:hypothetical protein
MSSISNNIVSLWVQWYFFEMPQEILLGWRNFLFFGLNFFSIPLLLKTLFSHWKKYYWVRGRGFDIGEYFSVLFSNLMSRFLGALVRIVLIIVGIVFEIIIFVCGAILFVGWFVLPILLISGVLIGIFLIF